MPDIREFGEVGDFFTHEDANAIGGEINALRSGKSPIGHTHVIEDVSGLADALGSAGLPVIVGEVNFDGSFESSEEKPSVGTVFVSELSGTLSSSSSSKFLYFLSGAETFVVRSSPNSVSNLPFPAGTYSGLRLLCVMTPSGIEVVNSQIDTTYSEISESEIDSGTGTTLRTVTGRRIKYAINAAVALGGIKSYTATMSGTNTVSIPSAPPTDTCIMKVTFSGSMTSSTNEVSFSSGGPVKIFYSDQSRFDLGSGLAGMSFMMLFQDIGGEKILALLFSASEEQYVSYSNVGSSLTVDNASGVRKFIVREQNANFTIDAPTDTGEFSSLMFRFRDNGTSRVITWNPIYISGSTTLPGATTVGKATVLGFKYDGDINKWVCMAKAVY